MSEASNYNDGLDQIVLTDMTTVSALDEPEGGSSADIGEEESNVKYKRTVSTVQVSQVLGA